MKLTTGYEFQGYFITEYLDVIFDEMIVGLGFGKSIISSFDNVVSAITGSEATEMIDKLNAVKTQLRDRVIEKAKRIGADALIGIDFESSKLGDLIMVSMTATAVKIDKIISPLPLTQQEQQRKEEESKKKKLEEEKAQRLAYFQEHPDKFDKELFIQTIQEYDSMKDIVTYVIQARRGNPLIDDELIEKLRRCAELERFYGKGTGKRGAIEHIKKQLGM